MVVLEQHEQLAHYREQVNIEIIRDANHTVTTIKDARHHELAFDIEISLDATIYVTMQTTGEIKLTVENLMSIVLNKEIDVD